MTILAPRTPGGRGLGLIDPHRWDPKNNAHPAHTSIGAIGSLPKSVSMTDLVFIPPDLPFMDQFQNQKCVGCMGLQVVHVTSRAMGITPITPSDNALYYQGRARRYGWDAIWDGGSNPHEVLSSMREVGIVRYADWPHDTAINACPPPDAYRKGADKDWFTYEWILSGSTARTRETMAILASRCPVGAALQVDEGLEAWMPGDDPWERCGPILGGHAVTIVGYYVLASGEVVFIVANSWGAIHDHGFFLLSQRALESNETTYLWRAKIDPEKVP